MRETRLFIDRELRLFPSAVMRAIAAAWLPVVLSSASLQADIQSYLDHASDVSGYSFSVGYHDGQGLSFGVGSGSRTPRGLPPGLYPGSPTGTVTATDTMLLGSGTKPFTAAGVMRLCEQKKMALADAASKHLDPVLQAMNGTTFVGLFGARAAKVTVGHILSMKSGIADYDVPDIDNAILVAGAVDHPILSVLHQVAAMPAAFGCAPDGQKTWETYDQLAGLGLAQEDYPNTHALLQGTLNESGLSVAGDSLSYCDTGRHHCEELYRQDATILGWTCGNMCASAHDVARFFFDLLGPSDSPVVDAASVKTMMNTSTLNKGWAAGHVDYGYGLMIQNVVPRNSRILPPLSAPGSYIGHGGDTFGFMSDNGFYPGLNASIVVIINEDADFMYPTYVATCSVVQLVMQHQGKTDDLGCIPPTATKYVCEEHYGLPTCVPSFGHRGTSRALCSVLCKSKADAVTQKNHPISGRSLRRRGPSASSVW
jgi:hypothetical protein